MTTRSKIATAALMALGLTGATIGIANAQSDNEPSTTAATSEAQADGDETDQGDQADAEADRAESTDADPDEADPDTERAEDQLDECFDWEPGPEEIAEIEAEMEALREAFDAAGIAYTTVVDDELGVVFVEWDFEDDAANEVAESVFGTLEGELIVGDELPEDCEGIMIESCEEFGSHDGLDGDADGHDDIDDGVEEVPAAA